MKGKIWKKKNNLKLPIYVIAGSEELVILSVKAKRQIKGGQNE